MHHLKHFGNPEISTNSKVENFSPAKLFRIVKTVKLQKILEHCTLVRENSSSMDSTPQGILCQKAWSLPASFHHSTVHTCKWTSTWKRNPLSVWAIPGPEDAQAENSWQHAWLFVLFLLFLPWASIYACCWRQDSKLVGFIAWISMAILNETNQR